MNFHKYVSVGSVINDGINTKLYRFLNEYNDFVIVEVFHHPNNVYVVKFFLKKHRYSDKRYNLVYPNKYRKRKGAINGSKCFLKVMNTVLQISLEILNNDPIASFGYMGAPIKEEQEDPKRINVDGTIIDTKRYKVYLSYVKRYFDPSAFEYLDSNKTSIMLLRNNKNKTTLTKKVADNYIKDIVIPNLY